MLEETPEVKLEATTDETGRVVFNMTATESMIGRTFTLKLYEVAGQKANVTYSNAVYVYEIKIGLSADNKLVADITCNGQAVSGTTHTAQFENVYNYTPPATPPTGDSMNLNLWFTLAVLSMLGIVVCIIARKKIAK